jgi:hypothetical protein
LNNFNSSQRPDDAGRRAGLARLVRRICLLREQGDATEARRLQENDLAAAVGEIRRADGAESLRDDEVVALFAAEAVRVDEALFTAEVLIRRLIEIWPAAPAPIAAAARATPLPAEPAARPAPAGPLIISDLLDAMLAAERPRPTRP